MKKVLLMLTDIKILPSKGCVYLIDEYENSLGINAINFFPTMLIEADSQSQFIITSHHPYIIGNVPVKNWIVFNRKGNTIAVKQGDELEDRYSKSKQQAFIQLINDPFFVENIE
jgi:predicted ATPase